MSMRRFVPSFAMAGAGRSTMEEPAAATVEANKALVL
jgi:hypothetical protein